MSKVFLKRINKEIQNFYEKKYLENNNNFSDYLISFLDNLKVEVVLCNYGEGDKYFLIITNLQTKSLFLELEIPDHYPFKPYSVVNYNSKYVFNSKYLTNKYFNYNGNNKISYSKYMNNIYEKIKDKDKTIYAFFFKNLYGFEPKFLNLKKNDCYCCSSIICSNLWSPSITFNNLIFEQLELQFIEKYSSELGYKYLVNIYKNYYNILHNQLYKKLPDEIISKILN